MLYLVIEHFRDGDPLPVYRRFRDEVRLAPDGATYHASWVTTDYRHCYQVMECANEGVLGDWMARWSDLVEFEVLPVVTSADAAATIVARLGPTSRS